MSSSAILLMVKARPSKVISNPAMPPTSVERDRRRASRTVSNTSSAPKTQAEIRHPKGVIPKKCSPIAISHLPSGGCTTAAGPSVKPLRSPSAILASVLNGLLASHCLSYPECSSPQASFA